MSKLWSIKNILTNTAAYSFIETIAAVGIFSLVVLLAGSSMQNVASVQRNSIASQNAQENLRYIFESVSKEVRDAQGATSTCANGLPVANKVFNTNATSSVLSFVNKNGQCVFYRVESGRFKIKRGNDDFFATPDEITVQDLRFRIDDNATTTFAGTVQPIVTMMLRIKTDKLVTTMQTAISSRHYE